MNNSSKALVNNIQEFCFDQKEIESLNILDHGDDQLHMIFENESVIAKVIAGKDVVLKFYDGYGDKLGRKQDSIAEFGNAYLREKFPKVIIL